MKIILFGYGNMGKTIEKLALKRGHEILLKINSENAINIKPQNLLGGDVALEFTKPETAYKNVMLCFEANIPVVCGTTGWSDKLVVAEEYCRENHKSLFYASNFSLGVNLFYEINILLAKLMNTQTQYDEILIHESQ